MILTTEYYDEYIRYFYLALDQQKKCNVSTEEPFGMMAHVESDVGDDLMHHVELYDVVERKDRKSTRLNSSHIPLSRMPSSA